MAKTPDFSPETVNAMLKMASAKLGMTPEQLQKTLMDPKKADELLSNLPNRGQPPKTPEGREKMVEELLKNNPQLKKILGEALGDKHNG